MLRRQRDSAGVLRGLFNPESRSRNLAAAAVLRADGRTVVREREGLLGWLKGIFNKAATKSNEDRGSHHEIAAALQQRNRPEIAVAEVMADPPRKVDVVNQKLANVGAAEPTTTGLADRKFRSVGQRDAVQRLAICRVESPSGVDYERASGQKSRQASLPERGRDSIRSSSRLALADELRRAERIGGAIEFAARDDPDMAAHYRRYTGPGHCYRLPTPKQPSLLLATYGPNRNVSVPTRAIATCAAEHSAAKPPIREPDMPEKRERKDEKEREDKKKKKKKEPVIRTGRESIDSSENRAAMVAEDNPTGDPDAPFRYEWGVKLAEEEPAGASDNDNLAEKGRRYVTKRLWGVNLTHPDVEGAAPPTSDSPGSGTHRNASRGLESEDTKVETGEPKSQAPPSRALANERLDSSSRGAKDEESLSTWTDLGDYSSSASGDSVRSQQDTGEVSSPSSRALRRVMRAVPGASREAVALEDGYNAPRRAAPDVEVSAWRNLALKAKPAMLAILSAARPDRLEGVSIRPEAPQPKLDVRVVRSTEDVAEVSKDEQSVGFKLSSMGLSSRAVEATDTPSLDKKSPSPSKKLHTASARTRYNARRDFGSLPVDPAPAGASDPSKDSSTTPAPSVNSEGSAEEKPSDEDGQQQADLESINEERSSSPDTSDSLGSAEPRILAASAETASSGGDREQLDAEADVSETIDTIADGQLQHVDRESTDGASTSTMEEECPRAEDTSLVGSETPRESHEDSRSSYNRRDSCDVERNVVAGRTADGEPTKFSHEDGSAGEVAEESMFARAKNTVLDSNAEDDASDDDLGGQYVTDGDYARVPGDPYPYSKENLAKWRMPVSKSPLYAPIKRQTVFSGLACDRSSPRNANSAYANATSHQSYGSHAVGTATETSGSGDGAMAAKNVGLASGFRDSSRDQRVVAADYDAVDALGLREWTEALSRLDNVTAAAAAAATSGKTNEAERGDNASLRAYHQ